MVESRRVLPTDYCVARLLTSSSLSHFFKTSGGMLSLYIERATTVGVFVISLLETLNSPITLKSLVMLSLEPPVGR